MNDGRFNNNCIDSHISGDYGFVRPCADVFTVEGRPLDSSQQNAALNDSYNLLVTASAGTGKTTAIIAKVKHLLSIGYLPSDILALSFTRSASKELHDRIYNETGEDVKVCTFHKLGFDIIKSNSSLKIDVLSHETEQKILFDIFARLIDNPSFVAVLYTLILTDFAPICVPKSNVSPARYIKSILSNHVQFCRFSSFSQLIIYSMLKCHSIEFSFNLKRGTFYLNEYGIKIICGYKSTDSNTITYSCDENSVCSLAEKIAHELIRLNVPLKIDPEFKSGLLNQISSGTFIAQISNMISLMKLSGHTPSDSPHLLKAHGLILVFSLSLYVLSPVFNMYSEALHENRLIDFHSMIALATYAAKRNIVHNYSYVIIDEYQDINPMCIKLISAMRSCHDFKLMCVGDDCQSIFGFAGSRVDCMTEFERHFGKVDICNLDYTYRFNSSIANASAKFVFKNPNQLQKSIISTKGNDRFSVRRIYSKGRFASVQRIYDEISCLPENSSVFLLGRYRDDAENFMLSKLFIKLNVDKTNIIDLGIKNRPDISIKFLTIHKAKGLEADYVFLLSTDSKSRAFPSSHTGGGNLFSECLMPSGEKYPNAEERRVFYVALTRAKKILYLVMCGETPSEFVRELIADNKKELSATEKLCPICNSSLRKKRINDVKYIACKNCSYSVRA